MKLEFAERNKTNCWFTPLQFCSQYPKDQGLKRLIKDGYLSVLRVSKPICVLKSALTDLPKQTFIRGSLSAASEFQTSWKLDEFSCLSVFNWSETFMKRLRLLVWRLFDSRFWTKLTHLRRTAAFWQKLWNTCSVGDPGVRCVMFSFALFGCSNSTIIMLQKLPVYFT